jgi:hypothetical protein
VSAIAAACEQRVNQCQARQKQAACRTIISPQHIILSFVFHTWFGINMSPDELAPKARAALLKVHICQ